MNLSQIVFTLLRGEWTCGYEYWKGKPKLNISAIYYDGFHICLHLGKFWVEIDY
jgi:hypothetical protein